MVTLNDMKNYLGIPLLDTSYDDFLTEQLQLIEEVVESYCKRKFALATYTQTIYAEDMNGKNLNAIPMYHFPIVAVTSINESNGGVSPVAVTDFRTHKPTATITKINGGRFLIYGDTLEVVYSAGYASIPKPIIHVIKSLVQERYNKKMNGVDLNFGTDVQRISIPGAVSIDFDYSLSNNERKSSFGSIIGNHANVLDAYRSERAVIGDIRLAYVG